METTKTYADIKYDFCKLKKTIDLYDKLHEKGIAYNKVHYYKTPNCSSDYSMGETICVECNGEEIQFIDNRQYYAKSCTWRPKHGYIILDFSKKDLKRYVEIGKDMETALKSKNTTLYYDLQSERNKLLIKAFVREKSMVKSFIA